MDPSLPPLPPLACLAGSSRVTHPHPGPNLPDLIPEAPALQEHRSSLMPAQATHLQVTAARSPHSHRPWRGAAWAAESGFSGSSKRTRHSLLLQTEGQSGRVHGKQCRGLSEVGLTVACAPGQREALGVAPFHSLPPVVGGGSTGAHIHPKVWQQVPGTQVAGPSHRGPCAPIRLCCSDPPSR